MRVEKSKYVSRNILPKLIHSNSKIVVLEGARAVGKTTLVQKELVPKGYKYFSFLDDDTYKEAKENIYSWISFLPNKAIIDEAQRIPELPLAIKERIDNRPIGETYYVLTGSSSIGRSGLDGQDPLARRTLRYTLQPITQWEKYNQPGSIVDLLFSGNVNEKFSKTASKDELYNLMLKGGFPQYMTNPNNIKISEIANMVRMDIDAVLGSDILLGEKLDQGIAKKILNTVLTCPGKIFNASKLGRDLGFDSRTIERYLSIFKNRFLVHSLANFKQSAHAQNISRAKIHPIDTSFTIAALISSGRDIKESSSLFGEVLESYVVNQIVSAAQYSDIQPESFYWREAGRAPNEVDLLLVQNGRNIGIEIKSSQKISPEDFKGLLALNKASNLTRGYIFYLGNRVIRYRENMWALPIGSLWNVKAFENVKPANRQFIYSESQENKMSSLINYDANLFLSYHHNDNDHLDNLMIEFMHSISNEYEFTYGGKLNIFIDNESINWGEDWQSVIERSLLATNFILPCITPRYISSDSCRDELTTFLEYSNRSQFSSVLSLVWQDPKSGNNMNESDVLFAIINKYQFIDVSGVRDLDKKDKEYKNIVRKVVSQLRDVIVSNQEHFINDENNQDKANSPSETIQINSTEDDEYGLFERYILLAKQADNLSKTFENAGNNLKEITEVINGNPMPSACTQKDLTVWSLKIAEECKKPQEEIVKSTKRAEKSWDDMYENSNRIIAFFENAPLIADKETTLLDLKSSLIDLKMNVSFVEDAQEVEDAIRLLSSLTSRFRPMAKAVSGYLNLFKQISLTTGLLIQRVDAALENIV